MRLAMALVAHMCMCVHVHSVPIIAVIPSGKSLSNGVSPPLMSASCIWCSTNMAAAIGAADPTIRAVCISRAILDTNSKYIARGSGAEWVDCRGARGKGGGSSGARGGASGPCESASGARGSASWPCDWPCGGWQGSSGGNGGGAGCKLRLRDNTSPLEHLCVMCTGKHDQL